MTYFEFFSKYSDMFYYLTFLLGVTNISYNFFEYLSFSHKYDSSQLSKLEGRIHTRLNDIDNKINMLYKIKLCEISHAVSDPETEFLSYLDANKRDSDSESGSESNSDSDNNESIIEDEDEDNNSDEKSDYEIEEDSIENEDRDNDNEDNNSNSDSRDNDELETIEELEASKEPEEPEEPEENVCVDQNDINDYYKDKFIKDKQINSLSLSGIFRGWY